MYTRRTSNESAHLENIDSVLSKRVRDRVGHFLPPVQKRMCYSAEVSLGTFVSVSLISIFLFMRNKGVDRAVGGILFVTGCMQFLEYLLWMNPTCNDINKAITSIIPIYLYWQPAMFNLIVWALGAGWGTLYPLIILLHILLFPVMLKLLQGKPPCIFKGECGHLDWNHKNYITLSEKVDPILVVGNLFYYFSLFYSVATLKNVNLSILIVLLWAISWFISVSFYKKVWGSIWCHSATAAGLFALFV